MQIIMYKDYNNVSFKDVVIKFMKFFIVDIRIRLIMKEFRVCNNMYFYGL